MRLRGAAALLFIMPCSSCYVAPYTQQAIARPSQSQPLPSIDNNSGIMPLPPDEVGYILTIHKDAVAGNTLIRLVEYPSMKEIIYTPRICDEEKIHYRDGSVENYIIQRLSGPDINGRFVYARGPYDTNIVVIANIASTEEYELTRVRAGASFQNMGLGKHIALSPRGGMLAFVRDVKRATDIPNIHRTSKGTLEVWDIDRRRLIRRETDAMDFGLAWFPDGRHLVYIEILPREVVSDYCDRASDQGFDMSGIADWPKVPSLVVLDVESGDTEIIGIGERPIVSPDGDRIMMIDFTGNVWVRGVHNDIYESINLPNKEGPIIAWLPVNTMVYWGRPGSNNQPIIRSPYGSFYAGMAMKPILICDLLTNRWGIIHPPVDPRHAISFGVVAR